MATCNYIVKFIILQTHSLLKHMNLVGFRDGVTGGLDQSVDGLLLQVHLNKLTDITKLATSGVVHMQ